MDYHIIKISRNKKQYLDLLLLGDEQETMIDRYLERGDLFVLEDNGIKAVGVVTKEGPEICELKNIAVTPLVLDTPVLPQAAGLPLALYLFFSGGCTVPA